MTDVDSDAFEQWNSAGSPLVHVHARAQKFSAKKVSRGPLSREYINCTRELKSLEQEAIGKVSWL